MKPVILPYKGQTPTIHSNAFIAPGACIIGDVTIGEGSSVWYNAVIRGDVAPVTIGRDTNIQDGCVIHVSTGGKGTHIGDRVTVGHMALLHECVIDSGAYIGMQSLILDNAHVQTQGFLAAGALLSPGKILPSGEVWAGRPARLMRAVTDDERAMFEWSWAHYRQLAADHGESMPFF